MKDLNSCFCFAGPYSAPSYEKVIELTEVDDDNFISVDDCTVLMLPIPLPPGKLLHSLTCQRIYDINDGEFHNACRIRYCEASKNTNA